MFDWFWEFLYGIVKAALYCIDFIGKIAEMLCGIKPINITGESGGEAEITSYFLMNDLVLNAFKAVALVGFALLVIFTIYSIIRSQGNPGEGKTPVRTCLDASKILIYFLLVPLIMYLASSCISYIMSILYEATRSGGSSSIGSSLFCVFADEAYSGSASKAEIMEQFLNGTKDYYSTSEVWEYFNLKSFNYFLGFVGGISVLILLALSLLSFVERILSLMLLFVVAPISMSTAVLDDGARFKLWRDQTINKFLMAYGSLICLNLYMMMVQIVNTINFFDADQTFFNGLARLVFIVGGAFACRKAGALVGNLINHGAGSQDAQDQANINGGFKGLAFMAGAAAARVLSPVAGAVGGAAKKPFSMLGNHIKKDASAAIHRRTNASRAAKDDQMRRLYQEKLDQSPRRSRANEDLQKILQNKTQTNDGSQAMTASPTAASATGQKEIARGGSSTNEKAGEITRAALSNVNEKKRDEEKKGDE